MEQKDLIHKIAKLESINDQLSTEIRELDKLARDLGFSDGLETLKAAALELLQENNDFKLEDEEDHPFFG